MALTARFLADFTDFYGAVSKATSQLDGLQKEANESGAALNKMVTSLSGDKATKDLEKLTDATKQSSSSFDAGLGSLTKWAAGLVTVTVAVDLAQAAFSTLVGFISDSVNAASESEASNAKLAAAMRAQGTAVPEVISAYQRYGAELQKTTRYEDDAVTAAQAILVTVGGVMPREMEKATKAVADYAAATGKDLPEAAQDLARAASGSTTAIEKQGIQLDDTRLKSEGFYVLDQVNAKMGGQAVAAANTYAGRLEMLSNQYGDLQENVGRAIIQNQTVIEALQAVSDALGGTSGEFSENQEVMNLVSDAVILTVRALGLLIGALGNALGPIRSTIHEGAALVDVLAKINSGVLKVTAAGAPFNDTLANMAQQAREDQKNLEGWSASLRDGADAVKVAQDAAARLATQTAEVADKLEENRGKTLALTAATNQHANASNLATANAWQRKAAEKAAADALAAGVKSQQAFEKSMRELEGSTRGTLKVVEQMPPSIAATTAAFEQVAPAAGRALAGIERMPPTLKQLGLEFQSVGQIATEYLGEQFGQDVLAAIQGGGSAIQSAMTGFGNKLFGKDSALNKSMTQGIGDMFGSSGLMGKIGGAVAGMVPMIGSFIGPAIEGITALGKKLFGPSEESSKVSPLRDEFFKLQGGIESLNPRVQALTGNLSMVQAVFDAKTVEEYNAAIADLNSLFEQEAAAVGLVTETAKKYGLTLEELGPAFARQELDKKAQELYRDYEVLIAAGVKNTTVTKKMADEVNKYVQDAMKMGVAVPSAMKPMLEKMAQMGVLTDSSGKKIKDVEKSGIKFALTMSEGFEKLIDSVEQLTHVIAGSLGVSLDKTKSKVEAIPDKINIKVNYDEGDRPKPLKGGTTTVKGYQGGTKGFEDFGAGTLVMLHGREAVVPQSAVRSPGHGTAAIGAPGVTVIINAQGSFFDTPGDLQRLADKVNAALTAKHGMTNRARAS